MLPPWPQIAAVNQPRMNMSDCGCHPQAENPKQRRVLWIALALNAAMASIGGIAGWMAPSTGLLADALDMLSDASSYSIGPFSTRRSARFQTNSPSGREAVTAAFWEKTCQPVSFRVVAATLTTKK